MVLYYELWLDNYLLQVLYKKAGHRKQNMDDSKTHLEICYTTTETINSDLQLKLGKNEQNSFGHLKHIWI
jgi:hypothetical protein